MLQILNPFKAGDRFAKLKLEKRWKTALAIVFAVALLSGIGSALIEQKQQDLSKRYVEERMGEMETLTEQERQSVQSFQESLQGIIVILGFVLGIIGVIVAWVVKSAALHLTAKGFGGENVDIATTIHVIAYTYLPLIFKGIVSIYRGLTYQAPSYQEFVRAMETPDVAADFVRSNLNIFVIWAIIITVIAVREIFNVSNKKAVLVVLIPYIGFWVLQIALMYVGAFFTGGM